MSQPTKAVRIKITPSESLSIEAYTLATGETRYAFTHVSLVLGYSKQWLSQVLKRGGSRLDFIQEKGFTGSHVDVIVGRDGISGASLVKTISQDDFCILVKTEAHGGNQNAIALLAGFFETGLEAANNQPRPPNLGLAPYKLRLRSWLLAEVSAAGSLRKLAAGMSEKSGLKITYGSIEHWIGGDFKKPLSQKGLEAIAVWRGEPVEQTEEWLHGN